MVPFKTISLTTSQSATIGTTLSAQGIIYAQGGNSNLWNQAYTNVQSNSGSYVLQGGNTVSVPLSVGTNSTQPLILETNSTNRVTILSSGQVGIGTSNPNNTLTVGGKMASDTLQIGDYTLASPGYVNISSTGVISFSGSGTGIYEQVFLLPGGGGYFRRDGVAAIHNLAGEQGRQYILNGSGLRIGDSSYVGWTSDAAISSGPDTFLFRDATSGIIAQRNGLSAQTFRLYNTYTDASNFERGFMRWTTLGGTALEIGTEQAGTGAARPLRLLVGGTSRVVINSSEVTLGVPLQWGSGATRIIGTTFPSGLLQFQTGSTDRLTIDANGIIGIGGTTNTFPALKRSGTGLQVRLADDTAFAPVTASTFVTPTEGNSSQWNNTYTTVLANSASWATDSTTDTGVRALTGNWQNTYTTVLANSASWEESAEILPTVTNYLSTSNVLISGLNVTRDIVANRIQATVKNFYIKHPTKPDKHLVYSSLETPYNGVQLTGEAELINGQCIVELPDYLNNLIHLDSVHIQLTNYQHSKSLYVDRINIDQNNFTVKCDSWFSKSQKLKFFWLLNGVRKDIERLETEV